MTLKEFFDEAYSKESLVNIARDLKIRGYSGLRKADLIDRIVEGFCSENWLKNRLGSLTDEQMNVFRKAYKAPYTITDADLQYIMALNSYWIAYIDEDYRINIYPEIAAVWPEMDDEAFRIEQGKKGWMMKCIEFFKTYYGIAPVETVHKLYSQKIPCTAGEMLELLQEIPVDMLDCIVMPMEEHKGKWREGDPIKTELGLLVHRSLLEEDEMMALLRQQADKPFYIPSVQQIEELEKEEYASSAPAYKKLETFFVRKMKMEREEAKEWCIQTWMNSYEGEMPTQVIHDLEEEEIYAEGEQQLRELIGLVMDAHSSTRMIENRGYAPGELPRRPYTGQRPILVPGSRMAASMLQEAAPQIEKMGLGLKTGAEKVYPNDPCPCGSGKKYKKCCGRK